MKLSCHEHFDNIGVILVLIICRCATSLIIERLTFIVHVLFYAYDFYVLVDDDARSYSKYFYLFFLILF